MAAAVTSMEMFMAAAIGATVDMASPSCATSVFARLDAAARISATRPDSAAARAKPDITLVAISAVCASPIADEAARSNTPGIAEIACWVLNPAIPKNCNPSAASAALKTVDAPSSRAVFESLTISASVARVIARTLAMEFSKLDVVSTMLRNTDDTETISPRLAATPAADRANAAKLELVLPLVLPRSLTLREDSREVLPTPPTLFSASLPDLVKRSRDADAWSMSLTPSTRKPSAAISNLSAPHRVPIKGLFMTKISRIHGSDYRIKVRILPAVLPNGRYRYWQRAMHRGLPLGRQFPERPPIIQLDIVQSWADKVVWEVNPEALIS